MRHKAPKSPFRVPYDGSFKLEDARTSPKGKFDEEKLEQELEDLVEDIGEYQRKLYASDHHAILLIFQAMDAAGKDSTIRAILTGVDPTGCQVTSFKAPSHEELDHDFLWRTTKALPERGRIGVFNRSYYEEVLTVRVHPEFLAGERLPTIDEDIWDERLQSIRNHERHLRRNGTIVLKFFLNVSREEQKNRLLARLDDPKKLWKFDPADLNERARWPDYMNAYQEALNHTSREEAPWYCIPADNKPFARVAIAQLIVDQLKALDLEWPELTEEETKSRLQLRDSLVNETDSKSKKR